MILNVFDFFFFFFAYQDKKKTGLEQAQTTLHQTAELMGKPKAVKLSGFYTETGFFFCNSL